MQKLYLQNWRENILNKYDDRKRIEIEEEML